RALARVADAGFTFSPPPEVECHRFQALESAADPLVPVDTAGYFDHVARGQGHDFRRAAITLLESMGISVEFSHHEAGPGQDEIELLFAESLSNVTTTM